MVATLRFAALLLSTSLVSWVLEDRRRLLGTMKKEDWGNKRPHVDASSAGIGWH